jgi:hypothetical protein
VIGEYLSSFRMAHGSGSLSMSRFETQFREHALNAREHGDGHKLAIAANQANSKIIVAVYKALRFGRELLRGRTAA